MRSSLSTPLYGVRLREPAIRRPLRGGRGASERVCPEPPPAHRLSCHHPHARNHLHPRGGSPSPLRRPGSPRGGAATRAMNGRTEGGSSRNESRRPLRHSLRSRRDASRQARLRPRPAARRAEHQLRGAGGGDRVPGRRGRGVPVLGRVRHGPRLRERPPRCKPCASVGSGRATSS